MATATAYNVELRNKDGYLIQYLTPFIKELSWEWNRIGGCGRCRLVLQMEYRKIEFSAGDDIQIRIKSGATSKLVYRGWVSLVVPTLKFPQEISLDVRGYFDLLGMRVVSNNAEKKTYSNYLLSDIVADLIDSFVTPSTDITKGTIDSAIFTPDTLQFKCTVAEALKTLADLEGKIEYGVDENLVFFWRAQNDDLRHKFFVGNNIAVFERRVDWNRLLNKIFFEGGDIDGTTYKQVSQAQDSQEQYFLAEGIITNSAIITQSVADQYCSAILRERSAPSLLLKIKVPETDLRLEDTVPLGAIAVYDRNYDQSVYVVGEAGDGGSDLTIGSISDGGSGALIGSVFQDQVDKIEYTLSDTEGKFNIEITLGGSILETSAKIKQIELLLSDLRQR